MMNIIVGDTISIQRKKVVVTDVVLTRTGKSGSQKLHIRGKDANGDYVETMWTMVRYNISCGHDQKIGTDGVNKCEACRTQDEVPTPESQTTTEHE